MSMEATPARRGRPRKYENAAEKSRAYRQRVKQRLALLQTVEALRMYAAEHDGKLPADLSEIRLPLPPDPRRGPTSAGGSTARGRPAPQEWPKASPEFRGMFSEWTRRAP